MLFKVVVLFFYDNHDNIGQPFPSVAFLIDLHLVRLVVARNDFTSDILYHFRIILVLERVNLGGNVVG